MKLKRLSKQDREQVNRMAEIIRNCRCSNGYISPHIAAQSLYEAGYKKQISTSGVKAQ